MHMLSKHEKFFLVLPFLNLLRRYFHPSKPIDINELIQIPIFNYIFLILFILNNKHVHPKHAIFRSIAYERYATILLKTFLSWWES